MFGFVSLIKEALCFGLIMFSKAKHQSYFCLFSEFFLMENEFISYRHPKNIDTILKLLKPLKKTTIKYHKNTPQKEHLKRPLENINKNLKNMTLKDN